MVRLLLLAVLALSTSAFSSGDCSTTETNAGLCDISAQVTETTVVLGGTVTSPGVEETDDIPEWAGPEASAPDDLCQYVVSDRCLADPDHSVADAVVQPLTLADVAAFQPQPGVDRMQPNGWAVIGLDTNFFAEASAEVVDGSLLGQPASVRFTPIGYTWSYGDGATRSTTTAGSAWVREFDPTPTSHVYSETGTFVVDLTVSYVAEYRFAGLPWLPISGTLALPTPPLTVTVGDAKTLLVARDCAQNPAGPAC